MDLTEDQRERLEKATGTRYTPVWAKCARSTQENDLMLTYLEFKNARRKPE